MDKEAENLIQGQRELHGRVSWPVDNLKKLGQTNITTGAVQSRLASLDSCWSKFETEHETLRTVYKEMIKGTDYIRKDYVGIVEEIYLMQKGVLLDYAARLAQQIHSAAFAAPRADFVVVWNNAAQGPVAAILWKIWRPHAFRDLFQSIIGKDGSLSEVEKFHYFFFFLFFFFFQLYYTLQYMYYVCMTLCHMTVKGGRLPPLLFSIPRLSCSSRNLSGSIEDVETCQASDDGSRW